MALPDYFKASQGTAISWKASGGTYVITLASLANSAAREGAKGDLGAAWAQTWHVLFTASVASAPVNSVEIELWWGPSTSATAGTDNPANLTGTDAALANPDEVKYQAVYLGSLILSNALGTAVQKQSLILAPPTRYGTPFVVNRSGQALGATAADHEIRLTPREDLIQDTV